MLQETYFVFWKNERKIKNLSCLFRIFIKSSFFKWGMFKISYKTLPSSFWKQHTNSNLIRSDWQEQKIKKKLLANLFRFFVIKKSLLESKLLICLLFLNNLPSNVLKTTTIIWSQTFQHSFSPQFTMEIDFSFKWKLLENLLFIFMLFSFLRFTCNIISHNGKVYNRFNRIRNEQSTLAVEPKEKLNFHLSTFVAKRFFPDLPDVLTWSKD